MQLGATHRPRHSATRDKAGHAHAALPNRALAAAQRVVGASRLHGPAVVAHPYHQRVVPPAARCERSSHRGRSLLHHRHEAVESPLDATVVVCEGVERLEPRRRVVWRVRLLKCQEHKERRAALVSRHKLRRAL